MNWEPYLLKQQAYVFGGPVMRAVLRAEPEDFQVDENLGFEPSGEGEHICYHIQKRNQNTAWLADQMARLAGVKAMEVSYSGQKDRRAVTTQWFSVFWNKPDLPDFSSLWNDDIQLLKQTRNNRKLRRGCHQGNRFRITLRDVQGDKAEIEARLKLISEHGVPNYFGEQRFGLDSNNLVLGEKLLNERVAGRSRRKDDRRETMYISALRSALFNRVLSARVANGSWNQLAEGDVLMLNGRNSFFTPKPEDTDLVERLGLKDIHPTGPLFGKGQTPVSAEVDALESEVTADAREITEGLARIGVDTQRRALRLMAQELQHTWLDDGSLTLEFGLTTGGFATSVLRELAQLEVGSAEAPVE